MDAYTLIEAVDITAAILHEKHTFDDPRPLRGYNHCECIATAREIVTALAPKFKYRERVEA